jgi:hypothetical protein
MVPAGLELILRVVEALFDIKLGRLGSRLLLSRAAGLSFLAAHCEDVE